MPRQRRRHLRGVEECRVARSAGLECGLVCGGLFQRLEAVTVDPHCDAGTDGWRTSRHRCRRSPQAHPRTTRVSPGLAQPVGRTDPSLDHRRTRCTGSRDEDAIADGLCVISPAHRLCDFTSDACGRSPGGRYFPREHRRGSGEAMMTVSAQQPWWHRGPVEDRCRGNHTYAGGCIYNADDPRRPSYPAELRPGSRMDQAAEAAVVVTD